MLDAYIIDRIRREREQSPHRRSSQVPLYIENPPDPGAAPPDRRRDEREAPDRGGERGSVVIDFKL